MIESRASGATSPPDTGASTLWTPRSAAAPAIAAASDGSLVLMSTRIAARAAAGSAPSGPSDHRADLGRIADHGEDHVRGFGHGLGVVGPAAPRASSGSAFARVRLWTVAEKPASQQMAAHADAHHAGADPADAGLSGCNGHATVHQMGKVLSSSNEESVTVAGGPDPIALIPAIFGPLQDLVEHDGLADRLRHWPASASQAGQHRQGHRHRRRFRRRAGGAAASPGFLANWLTSWPNDLLQADDRLRASAWTTSPPSCESAAAEFVRVEVLLHLFADRAAPTGSAGGFVDELRPVTGVFRPGGAARRRGLPGRAARRRDGGISSISLLHEVAAADSRQAARRRRRWLRPLHQAVSICRPITTTNRERGQRLRGSPRRRPTMARSAASCRVPRFAVGVTPSLEIALRMSVSACTFRSL